LLIVVLLTVFDIMSDIVTVVKYLPDCRYYF